MPTRSILRRTVAALLIGVAIGATATAQASNPGDILWTYPGSVFEVRYGAACLAKDNARTCHMHIDRTGAGLSIATHSGKRH